jgi:hypothetical protein
MHNRPSIEALQDLSPDAHDLVSTMIQRNPLSRPTALQICEHPFFWSDDRRLTFLCDFSDRLEMEGDGSSRVVKLLAVEKGAAQVVGTSWDSSLDDELVSHGQRYRTYDPSSVRDLLRLIRNKHHHFDELPTSLKEAMSAEGCGLLNYFEKRFPNLVTHCFRVCRDVLTKDDPLSIKYSLARDGPESMRKRIDCPGSPSKTIRSEAKVPLQETVQATEYLYTRSMSENAIGFPSRLVPDSSSAKEQSECDRPMISTPDRASIVEIEKVGSDVHNSASCDIGDVVIWHGSTAATTLNCRGWNRSDSEWVRRADFNLRKRDSNLLRCATDPKFRTRLCNHWDTSLGTFCPMQKKGKCVFAHSPIELRVKETKRKRWGRLVDANGDSNNPNHSGGEDTYGAARSIESERKQEGKWSTDRSTVTKGRPKNPLSFRKKADA